MIDAKYPHVLSYVMNTPWSILPEKMSVILDLLAFYVAGGKLTEDEIRERVGNVNPPVQRRVGFDMEIDLPGGGKKKAAGTLSVLPLFGTIFHRAQSMQRYSGGTSVEAFTQAFRADLEDPNVSAIVIDVNSPGGEVPGVEELAREIYEARGQKPIYAVANSMAASAAYWIASAADKMYVTPSGEVGHIGVFAVHQDISERLKKDGIAVSVVSAGKYKTELNPYQPLSKEARGALQARIDDLYGSFVQSVARSRGVHEGVVRDGFGEGRIVGAEDAVSMGMVDGVATLDSVLVKVQHEVAKSAPVTKQAKARAASPKAEGTLPVPESDKENEMDWENITLDELRANRPDLIEEATSDAVGTVQALSDENADLKQQLEVVGNNTELEDLKASLATANFQLALAEAAHIGVSTSLYAALQTEVNSLEELEAKRASLRMAAMSAYLKSPSSDGTPTGRAHPRANAQEGDPKPASPDDDLPADPELHAAWDLMKG
jgi:capsid assembly protease